LKTKYLQQRKSINSDSQTIRDNGDDDKEEENDVNDNNSGTVSTPAVDEETNRLMNTESDYSKKIQKPKKVSEIRSSNSF
jgi:hypothetical protein